MSNPKSIKIIGPFITNYSYAKVNRGLAIGLDRTNMFDEVYVYQAKEKIDKWPESSDWEKFPELKNLWLEKDKHTDIAIYNDYPKEGFVPHGFKEIDADFKILYIAWEESTYPEMWVNEINENLHCVITISTFVKEILENAGVKVPIKVIHGGLDEAFMQPPTAEYNLKTKKTLKFLHISTGRKRKGIDVLIKAYFETFTKEDDVCLVIKSFPSADNTVDETILELKTPDSPEIEHIYSPDLTEQDLVNLINTCDVGVYPTRAEGFGLTIFESMYHSKPTIATNYSAYLDICNDSNCFLLDYRLEDAIDSEQVNIGAKWAEPDVDNLKALFYFFYKELSKKSLTKNLPDKITRKYLNKYYQEPNTIEFINRIVNKGRESTENLTWENCAKNMQSLLNNIWGIQNLKSKKAGVISFLNSEDGLAVYTKDLFTPIENSFHSFYYLPNKDIHDRVEQDAENVIRLWESGETEFEELVEFIKNEKIEIIHIQYHSGINFPAEGLDNLIKTLYELGIEVFLTLHAVKGDKFDLTKNLTNLKLCKKIFIHNKEDLELLEASLDLNNLELFTHPAKEYKKREKHKLRETLGLTKYYPIVATHGMMNQLKMDLVLLIEVIAKLKQEYPDILYLSLNAVSANNASSAAQYEEVKESIAKLNLQKNTILIDEFLNDNQLELLLQSSDITCSPYKEVGESASGVVGKYIAARTLPVVTNIKMFDEYKDEVYKIDTLTVESIVTAIKDLLVNTNLSTKIIKSGEEYIRKSNHGAKSLKVLLSYCM